MTYLSECHLKVRFLDRRAAKTAIRRMRHREGRLIAYPCSWCGLFHIGHPQPNSRAASRRRREAAT